MTQDSIYLLVRADDIASSQAANQACIDVFTRGISRSVEIMAPCAWFPEAVKLLKKHPNYDVGVHLTVTSEWENVKWRPITAAPSLCDADGHFLRSFYQMQAYEDRNSFEMNDWKAEELERELCAQIELVQRHLPWVSHASFHMMGLFRDSAFMELVDQVIRRYDLKVDLQANGFQHWPGFGGYPKSVSLSPAEKLQTLKDALETISPGRWFFIDHPCYETPESRALHHIGYENVASDRQGVTESWTDTDVLEIIARRGIKLVSYADVKMGRID